MTCPYCSIDMEKGFLFSVRGDISWMRGEKLPWFPCADISLNYRPFTASRVRAWHCLTCRKIIIDLDSMKA